MKVTVVVYHPLEDESVVLGATVRKPTKAKIVSLIHEWFDNDPDVQVRMVPGTDIVETRQCWDNEWDEWNEVGCIDLNKVTVLE